MRGCISILQRFKNIKSSTTFINSRAGSAMCDKPTSRVIPNKKQSDANFILSNNTVEESDKIFDNSFDSRRLDSYESSAIFKSDNYLVIDKPHGVRMNGEFEVTVETLIRHWYPELSDVNLKLVHQLDYATSGALCVGLNRKAAAKASLAFAERRTKKKYLAVLRGHVDISKWAYCTSLQNQERTILGDGGDDESSEEGYVASNHENEQNKVNNAHRRIKRSQKLEAENNGELLSWQKESMVANLVLHYKAFLELLKSELKKKKNENENENTSVQNQESMVSVDADDLLCGNPSENAGSRSSSRFGESDSINNDGGKIIENAVTLEDAGNCDVTSAGHNNMNKPKEKHISRLSKIHKNVKFNSSCGTAYKYTAPPLLEQLITLSKFTFRDFERGTKLRKALRKALKEGGINVVEEILPSAHTSFPAVMAALEQKKQDEQKIRLENTDYGIKTVYDLSLFNELIFRLKSNTEKHENTESVISENSLLIKIPVAQVEGDFRMEPGHAGNLGRACETELQVLQYGTYQGLPVTKVLLKPLTGRRHQLRVHCLCLGHPIVGDFTYGVSQEEEMKCERMMLHAHSLKIPAPVRRVNSFLMTKKQKKKSAMETFVPLTEVPENPENSSETQNSENDEDYLVNVITRDPFRFVKDVLVIS